MNSKQFKKFEKNPNKYSLKNVYLWDRVILIHFCRFCRSFFPNKMFYQNKTSEFFKRRVPIFLIQTNYSKFAWRQPDTFPINQGNPRNFIMKVLVLFYICYMSQNYIFSAHGMVKARVIRYEVLRHVAYLKLYKPIYNLTQLYQLFQNQCNQTHNQIWAFTK